MLKKSRLKLNEYDLIAIGVPTHRQCISTPIKNFIEKLKREEVEGKQAFAFDTRVKHRFAGSAAKKIERVEETRNEHR